MVDFSKTHETCKFIHSRNIQFPDELAVINKWDILQLLIPGLTKDKVKTQKKNYAKLKTDNMLFLCIDTIVRMFIAIVYLDNRPETPNDKINLRSFKYMIKNKLDEIDELENELQKIKEKKGYIEEEQYDKEIKSLKQEFKRNEEDYKRRIQKLEDTEKYLREKIEKSEPRIKEQLMMKLKADGWQKVEEQKEDREIVAYN